MRARQPDRSGSVTRDGVTVGFDVYGETNSPTIVLTIPEPLPEAA